MKHLLLVVYICLQTFFVTDALAWSPLQSDRSTADTLLGCQWLAASSEENQEEQKKDKKEEEEEPDCD
jgi:hypothetical protein